MTLPRFFFITNDVAKAALEFSCHPGNLPGWMAMVDNFDLWMKIPSGSKCMGLWYGSAGEMEGWRNSWATRRERGDLIGITGEELDKIHAWAEEHRARPSRALLYGIASDPDGFEAVGAEGDGNRSGESISGEEGLSATPREGLEDTPSAPSLAAIDHSLQPKRSSKWT